MTIKRYDPYAYRIDEARMGEHIDGDYVEWSDVEPLLARIKTLEEAIGPFARQAAGIPDPWPGECVLTHNWCENTLTRGTWLSYAPSDAQGGPTIADWRRLREAVKG